MPYHTTKTKMPKEQKPKKKPDAPSSEPPISGLNKSNSKKLREHSKLHKGGMNSEHIKNMLKFMRDKKTFKTAHKMAVEIDNKKK